MCATQEQEIQWSLENGVVNCANGFISAGMATIDAITNGFVSNLTTLWNGGAQIPPPIMPMCPPGTPKKDCPTQGIPGDPG